MSSDEGWDGYLDCSSTQVDHETWMVNAGAPFHVTFNRLWFFDYKIYDGIDFFLGDELTTKIVGQGKVKLKLMVERLEHSIVFYTSHN